MASSVEDLKVYQMLCDHHILICDLTRNWPQHERFELGAQVRRSSNSAPANLAEKHGDKHLKNWIEGINRARGESLETIHHLYIAHRKGYLPEDEYYAIREDIQRCIRMLINLQRKAEADLPPNDRQFPEFT